MECRHMSIGSIFLLEDQSCISREYTKHFYLIIGKKFNSQVSFVQCMCITSMQNKVVRCEVPIALNGSVGYIVPYNIYSYKESDFKKEFYKGGICSPDISLSNFINLLLDIYKDQIMPDSLSDEFKEDVRRRFDDYIDKFSYRFKSLSEFRSEVYNNTGNAGYVPTYYNGRRDTDENVEGEIVSEEDGKFTFNNDPVRFEPIKTETIEENNDFEEEFIEFIEDENPFDNINPKDGTIIRKEEVVFPTDMFIEGEVEENDSREARKDTKSIPVSSNKFNVMTANPLSMGDEDLASFYVQVVEVIHSKQFKGINNKKKQSHYNKLHAIKKELRKRNINYESLIAE